MVQVSAYRMVRCSASTAPALCLHHPTARSGSPPPVQVPSRRPARRYSACITGALPCEGTYQMHMNELQPCVSQGWLASNPCWLQPALFCPFHAPSRSSTTLSNLPGRGCRAVMGDSLAHLQWVEAQIARPELQLTQAENELVREHRLAYLELLQQQLQQLGPIPATAAELSTWERRKAEATSEADLVAESWRLQTPGMVEAWEKHHRLEDLQRMRAAYAMPWTRPSQAVPLAQALPDARQQAGERGGGPSPLQCPAHLPKCCVVYRGAWQAAQLVKRAAARSCSLCSQLSSLCSARIWSCPR